LRLSPRFGISTPLGDFGKIYLNFGYFYGMCDPEKLYGEYTNYKDSIGILGNTRLDCLEKVSYELGFEKSLFDRYLLSISFYNSDYNHLIDDIWLLEYGGISYSTYTDDSYGNLRGLEFSLRKKYGKYFKGFLKYNINAGSYGGPGLDDIPIRTNSSFRLLLTFVSHDDWGKVFKDISASILYTREGGDYFSFDPYASNPFLPGDPDYINNLKWEDKAYWNLLLSKDISIRGFTFGLYAEVNNLFDSKYITGDDCFRGGSAGTDKLEYLRSLHLPMYSEERYVSDGSLIGGNDRVGKLDEDYIDKPDFEYLYYTNPRFMRLGVRVDF
jgi:outer membrane receptor protein involved in Fe transport